MFFFLEDGEGRKKNICLFKDKQCAHTLSDRERERERDVCILDDSVHENALITTTIISRQFVNIICIYTYSACVCVRVYVQV